MRYPVEKLGEIRALMEAEAGVPHPELLKLPYYLHIQQSGEETWLLAQQILKNGNFKGLQVTSYRGRDASRPVNKSVDGQWVREKWSVVAEKDLPDAVKARFSKTESIQDLVQGLRRLMEGRKLPTTPMDWKLTTDPDLVSQAAAAAASLTDALQRAEKELRYEVTALGVKNDPGLQDILASVLQSVMQQHWVPVAMLASGVGALQGQVKDIARSYLTAIFTELGMPVPQGVP